MSFSLLRPGTVEEALRILGDAAGGPAVPIAGGSDLLLDLEDGRINATRVVSLQMLPWRTLAWEGDSLVVGSTLPFSRLADDPKVRARLPGLAQAVEAVGSVALRHRATLGGNLGRSSPASDLLPILLATESTVRLVGPEGRRTVPVEKFVRGSRQTDLRRAELIEAVVVPSAPNSSYVWQRVRPANDVSQVGVSVAWRPDPPGWRLAVSGVLPTPMRIAEAEDELRAERPSPDAIARAGDAAAGRAAFVTDKRATESYRRRLLDVLVRRAMAAAQPGGARA